MNHIYQESAIMCTKNSVRIAAVSMFYTMAMTTLATANDIVYLQNCANDHFMTSVIQPGVNKAALIDPKVPPADAVDAARRVWIIEPVANNQFYIVNTSSNTVLERVNDEHLNAQAVRDGRDKQLWQIVPIDKDANNNYIYAILSKFDGKALDAKMSKDDLIMWTRQDSVNQRWRIIKIGQTN
jgi:hypothetical protein